MRKKYYQKKPDPIKLSRDGFEKAKSDVEKLSTLREEILVRLQTAREMGDLSENGAYKYAKFELRDCDRKLRHAKKLSMYGVVVEKDDNGVIGFGNTVTIKGDQGEMTFELVSGYESDPNVGKLSVYSPIGKAVQGKRPGDKVDVDVPAGKNTYEILNVV
ncbi:GreA/GreB family elongation factor [Patescibacteria group bacterium]